MKKLILIVSIGLIATSKLSAQADFDINLNMQPASVMITNTGLLNVSTCNQGNVPIVANSLRLTVSVGTNAEILGIAPGSDPRWVELSHTSGTNNTWRLTNIGTMPGQQNILQACASINLIVKGTVAGGPSVITGTIGYINANNPLLGGQNNASQGNASTANDNSTTSLIVVPAIVTPVTLLNFNGQLVNNSKVNLNWGVATEVNVKDYEVERSSDGNTWTTIGTVAAAARSSYGLPDLSPAAKNYYRLKVVDNDGKITYSNIVLITLKGKSGIVVYPSPSADGNINVSITGKGAKTVVLNDYTGRELKKWNNYENNTLRIEGLSSGIYLITVTENETGVKSVEKFVVNN